MKRLAILIGLLLPFSASALEYRNLSLLYTDAPFTPAESAGISVLTSLKAINGYPDGTFRPNRTVNRAEFLKIVLASYAKVRVSPSDAQSCFPDVHQEDWFSQYVCLAKKRGMIAGYPDGTFKPDRPVNYAEALKILSELYHLVAYSADDEEWYAGYVRAAQITKTALPSSIKYDRSLTRGQMARLAAAFRAYDEGELETYRLAERDLDLVVGKSSSSSSSVSSSTVSSVSSSSSSSSAQHITFPAQSHILVLGESQVIASGLFVPRDEAVTVKNVTVKLRAKAEDIAQMYLVDTTGHRIAQLKLDVYDNDDETWKTFEDLPAYAIQSEGKEFGIEAVIKTSSQGGVPQELIQVKWVSMNVAPIGTSNSYQIVASESSFPAHQTAAGRITSVTNNRPPVIDIEQGDTILLGEWEVYGEHIEDARIAVQHMTFTVAERTGVILSNLSLGAYHTVQTVPCSTENNTFINCQNIGDDIGNIEHDSILLQLWGTVDVDETYSYPLLKISLTEPGVLSTSINPGVMGHVRWTDGQGTYNWIELEKPIAPGSTWK